MAKRSNVKELTAQLQNRNYSAKSGAVPPKAPNGFNTTDLELPNWDDLIGLHETMAEGIVEFTTAVHANYREVSASEIDHAKIPNGSMEMFTRMVQTAIADSGACADTLMQIRARFQDKTGLVTCESELPRYYEIGDLYNNVYNQFQTLAFQASQEITTYLSALVTSVRDDQNLQSLTSEALASTSQTSTSETPA